MASTTSKLRLPKEPGRLLVYRAPAGYVPSLDINDAYEVHESIKGKFQWALMFAHTVAELETHLPKVYAACDGGAIIWMCFPKGSSKLQSDLTRDKGWDIIKKLPGQWLVLISINDDWSGFAMRKGGESGFSTMRREAQTTSGSNNPAYKPWVDNDKRVITLPPDILKALNAHKAAKTYFEGLAYSHKREYVIYILDAKKPETRTAHIDKVVTRLTEGKKNMTVK